MQDHIVLLKNDILIEINDFTEIKEEIKDLNENMVVEVKRVNSNILYSAFNETVEEHSRVRFLENDRFPDSIFISVIGGSIHCHICELKRTPANKLPELTEQLFSGYLHCKLLLSALHIDESKIDYFYHVFMINDKNYEIEHNRIPTRPKKIIPGKRIAKENRYDEWMKGQLTFIEENFKHNMLVHKHKYYKMDRNIYYYNFNL